MMALVELCILLPSLFFSSSPPPVGLGSVSVGVKGGECML
jgi:hypothetical protein